MSELRIDRIRNQTAATKTLLDTVASHLEDLHFLAYDRPAARDRLNVTHGHTDYALDTHGDPRARALLQRGMRTTDTACATLSAWCHDAISFTKNDGELTRRTRRTASAAEVNDALDAQQRRLRRGDYTPTRTLPQSTETLLAENRELRRKVRELETQLREARR